MSSWTRTRGLALVLIVCFLLSAGSARAAATTAPAGDELAAKVLPIFDVKCGLCHGPQAKTKEKFGYVTDLRKLAANSKLVVPGNSSKSKMWTSIEEGDMPPSEDDRSKPLTSTEKETIKAWIEAGALPGTATVVAFATTSPSQSSISAVDDGTDDAKFPPLSLFRRLERLTGRMHPLVVHFPIALLMAAAMAEAGWFYTRNVAFTGVVRFCVIIGGLGALAAAVLGWIFAIFRHGGDANLLFQHRWLGTAAGAWVIPIILLCEIGIRRAGKTDGMAKWKGNSRITFQVVLLIGVILIGVAAHIGGSIHYGSDFFNL